jgi:hypothetical protein
MTREESLHSSGMTRTNFDAQLRTVKVLHATKPVNVSHMEEVNKDSIHLGTRGPKDIHLLKNQREPR